MTDTTRPPKAPGVERAVKELLEAEVAFALAYGQWRHAPPEAQDDRRHELDLRERRLDEAMHAAQRSRERADDA